ncbi:MAG TPA: hypothetical protein VGK11_06400, partial [Actinomycetota bacterium]
RVELTQDDGEVLVSCRLDSIGRASLKTREVVAKLDGTVSAEAQSVVVAKDPSTGTSRPLTDEERTALERELEAIAG